jgi:pyruvate/2-oxoglutarate dehydrogenase complex dihydrolipoamide dehydrogenase (E3) component
VIRAILFRLPVNAWSAAIPRATFTDPEIAAVGLDEVAARQRHGDAVRVLRAPYADNDRARTEGETAGFIKLATGRRGRILGVGIVGHGAAEMINLWALAIQQKAGIGSFTGLVMPYPTYAEIGKRAALSAYRDSLTNPWLRRIIRLLARFG